MEKKVYSEQKVTKMLLTETLVVFSVMLLNMTRGLMGKEPFFISFHRRGDELS